MNAVQRRKALVGIRVLALVSFVLPIMYTWSLPALASVGFAVPFDPAKFPRPSISAYMSNARATGAMAVVMVPTFVMMWINLFNTYYTTIILVSLVLFQLGFSIMVICTVSWNLTMHKSGVFMMCVGAFLYCFSMLEKPQQHIIQTLLLAVGILCFGIMLVVAALNLHKLAGFERYFYFAEVIGLTAIVAYVPIIVWRNDYVLCG